MPGSYASMVVHREKEQFLNNRVFRMSKVCVVEI